MTEARTAEAILQDLPLSSIRPSATNPRKSFDLESLKGLADSIEAHGVQVPITVRPWCGHDGEVDFYELVCGERRWRAAKMVLGQTTIPAMVREMSDAEVLDVQMVENLQRADMHPMEEAEGYRRLIEAAEFPSDPDVLGRVLTAADVAAKVSKSPAHVARRLKLLELGLDTKVLFAKGHLSLDHALLLAPLTETDQVRALRFMLDSDPKLDKRPVDEVIRWKLREFGDSDDGDNLQEATYLGPAAKIARNMSFGRRMIDCTAAQLKRWIEGNCLLQLKNATWRLSDEDLVKRAGACYVCPKRSGVNAALFSELTADDQICLDPKCFAEKQDATVKEQKAIAKKTRGIMLKLSVVRSIDKLEEEAVTRRPLKEAGGVVVGESVEVTKKTIRAGQWVGYGGEQCPDVASGLLVDGLEKGKVLWVCANQACKVHKHEVRGEESSSRSSFSGGISTPRTPTAAELKREEAIKAGVLLEHAIRAKVCEAMLAKASGELLTILRRLLIEETAGSARALCELMSLDFPRVDAEGERIESYELDEFAHPVLARYIAGATLPQLIGLAMQQVIVHSLTPERWQITPDRLAKSREPLWGFAKELGVKADAIAAKMSMPVAAKAGKASKGKAAKKVAAKPVKKVAAKVAVKKKAVKR